MTIARTVAAEALKTRRTLILCLALIAPLAVVGFVFLLFLDEGEQVLESATENAWVELAHLASIVWALLVLPLFATLQTALLGGLEHNDRGWKHLYALPVPRWSVYAAKQAVAAGVMALSHVALVGLILLAGLVLWCLRPGMGFHAPLPWRDVLMPMVTAYLASWLLLAIHTWVGQRWHSFAVASAVGIVLTVAGVAVISSKWGSYYPWALPGAIVNGFGKGEPLPWPEFLLGWLGGLAFAMFGAWETGRRDVL